jgi:hypothetical protein
LLIFAETAIADEAAMLAEADETTETETAAVDDAEIDTAPRLTP